VLGNVISRIGERMKALRIWFSGPTLPSNTNFPLVASLRDLASRELPILILSAPHTQRRTGRFDYISYLQGVGGPKNQVLIKIVEGTGHSFSNPKGRATVRQNTQAWLNAFFPLNDPKTDEEMSQCRVNDGMSAPALQPQIPMHLRG
jgi:hypothetical protein